MSYDSATNSFSITNLLNLDHDIKPVLDMRLEDAKREIEEKYRFLFDLSDEDAHDLMMAVRGHLEQLENILAGSNLSSPVFAQSLASDAKGLVKVRLHQIFIHLTFALLEAKSAYRIIRTSSAANIAGGSDTDNGN